MIVPYVGNIPWDVDGPPSGSARMESEPVATPLSVSRPWPLSHDTRLRMGCGTQPSGALTSEQSTICCREADADDTV